jgi:hypothetical protein
MNKIITHLKLAILIILGGLAVPALLSIIFSGFRIDIVSIINYEFLVGIIIALIGGILISYNYSTFKKKVIKTPMDQDIAKEEETREIAWPQLLFCSGIIILIVAFALGEI